MKNHIWTQVLIIYLPIPMNFFFLIGKLFYFRTKSTLQPLNLLPNEPHQDSKNELSELSFNSDVYTKLFIK